MSLGLLIAWLDAGSRRDRDAMLALLAPAATWQGVQPEWRCETPEGIVDLWLERAQALGDDTTISLEGGDGRAVLLLQGRGIEAVDPSLRAGVHIGFEFDGEGRITRMADAARRRLVFPKDPSSVPDGVPEAPVVGGVPQGEGWFVVNVADARWQGGMFGAFTGFEGEAKFRQIGVNVGVLEPGQAACYYHREGDEEHFLVLRGEALLLVEGEERPLRRWDFVHCPPWTNHVFVGAGDGPCAVLAIGGRSQGGIVYPVDALALRHGAGVRTETIHPPEAYAEVPEDAPVAFDPRWLP